MNKIDYELIINSLQKHVNDCHIHLDSITSTDSLLKMTGEELIKLMEFAKIEVFSMTKILMVDLYHIIGMTNMSPIQTSKFIKLVKEYCKFRSDLKAIASNLRDLNNLPKLPTASKFRLTELCDLVLISEVRTGSEAVETIDESNLSEYHKACEQEKNTVGSESNTAPIDNLLGEMPIIDGYILLFTERTDWTTLQNYFKILGTDNNIAKIMARCLDRSIKHKGGFGWRYGTYKGKQYYQVIARSEVARARFNKLPK